MYARIDRVFCFIKFYINRRVTLVTLTKYFRDWQSGIQMVANQKCEWYQFHWLRGYLDVATSNTFSQWNWHQSHFQLATKTGIKNGKNILSV